MTSTIDTGEIAVGETARDLSLHTPDIDELNRLAADETLVLDQPPVATLPPAAQAAPPEDPRPRYRGEHRKPDPVWAWALIGAGVLALGEALAAGVVALVVTW